jgi:hypothetical protein
VPDGRWDELGIAPTDDPAAVRRAYAARLKTLDVDGDPTAFMRLRSAFEGALDDVTSVAVDDIAVFAPTGEREPARRAPLPEARIVSAFDVGISESALAASQASFHGFVAAGETRGAAALLQGMLAQGLIPFGAEDEFVDALVACTLADATMSADELAVIGRTFDVRELRERAQAMHWHARLLADAARGDGPFGVGPRLLRKRTRIARAIVAERHDLFSGDLPALRSEVATLQRHARWLPDGPNPDTVLRKLVKLERTLRAQEIVLVIGVLLFTGLYAVYQHFAHP